MSLPEDVRTWLRANFAPDQVVAASALLESAVDHSGRPASDRLRRCAAFASRGNIDDLKYYVDLLRIDSRDVIVAGEYDSVAGTLVRARDLQKPMGND